MGILPYYSPTEFKRFEYYHKIEEEFISFFGYKNCSTLGPGRPGVYLRRIGFLAPNGVFYQTADDMYHGYGKMPGYEKDGVCYNRTDIFEKHGYIDPQQDEFKFLENLGYEYKQMEDNPLNYEEQNTWYRNHFEQHGWVPRWSKDGKWYGHEQLLELEGYKYPVYVP